MNNLLAQRIFYICELPSNNILTIDFFLGNPEAVNKILSRVAIRISVNDVAGTMKYAFGADNWQALMIAISMIKLETKLLFQNKNISFHYTREDADQHANAIGIDELFPKDL